MSPKARHRAEVIGGTLAALLCFGAWFYIEYVLMTIVRP